MAHKLPKQLTPLVDCDILQYRCGFAVKEGEPVENSLHGVKKALNEILSHFPEREQQLLYLSGKSNFRTTYCNLLPVKAKPCKDGSPWKYKGNRDPSHKPIHYREIGEYLKEHWASIVVEGMEADDAMGIEQWANKDRSTVIVSTDKDMKMIPGWHYNWVNDKLYYIPLSSADTWLWQQMVIGDTVDNIPGVHGKGPAYAEDMVKRFKGDPSLLRKHVEDLYKGQYGDDWERLFDEVATLLWIRRLPDKGWRDYYGC